MEKQWQPGLEWQWEVVESTGVLGEQMAKPSECGMMALLTVNVEGVRGGKGDSEVWP